MRGLWLELFFSSAAVGFVAWTFIEAETIVKYLNERLLADTGFVLTPTPYRVLALIFLAYIVFVLLGVFLRGTLREFEGKDLRKRYAEELSEINEVYTLSC